MLTEREYDFPAWSSKALARGTLRGGSVHASASSAGVTGSLRGWGLSKGFGADYLCVFGTSSF